MKGQYILILQIKNVIIGDIMNPVIVQYWPILVQFDINSMKNMVYMFNRLRMKHNKFVEELSS